MRLITSHKHALEQIYRQYTLLLKHLMYVKNSLEEFGASGVAKSEDLLSMFGSRSTPLFMVFNLDIQQEFSIQSLRFQSNDQSIIGQSGSKAALLECVGHVDTPKGGQRTQSFLQEVQCFKTELEMETMISNGQTSPCMDIATYEEAPIVRWHGLLLGGTHQTIGKLSAIKDAYLAKIREEIDDTFPADVRVENGNTVGPLDVDVRVFFYSSVPLFSLMNM